MLYANLKEYLDELEKTSLKEFKEHFEVFEGFVTDPQWKFSLSFDLALFPAFAEKVKEVVGSINLKELDATGLETIMEALRHECVEFIKYADETEDAVLKWLLFRRAYALYGLVETITEGSVVTDAILFALKEEYKDDYLNKLKEMDEVNPSMLTDFKCETTKFYEDSQVSKLYLLMKKWQDDQHLFHNDFLFPKFVSARENFEKFVSISGKEYLDKVKGRNKIALYLLDSMPIIPIDLLSIFILSGVGKDIANVVGGKNMGLALLNSVDAKIPKTYAIPVGSLKENCFANELEKIEGNCFSVRSSATVEDNENQSFAGMFTSVLDVAKQNLEHSVRTVYNSLFNERVKSYVEHFKTEEPRMSVVIQSFKEPEFSGVWIGQTIDKGHLEWTTGNGEKLVSGKVTPTYEKWDENLSKEDTKKAKGIPLGEHCLQMQKKLNAIADFEWCILDNEFVWLQFRPVTKTFEVKETNIQKDAKDAFWGVAASVGITEGHPKYLEEPEEHEEFSKGDILLTDFTDPDWVPAILKSSAIATAEGGFLSHTAIISRELGIPCVTGLGYSAISMLSEADLIEVNGTNGFVKILKKS